MSIYPSHPPVFLTDAGALTEIGREAWIPSCCLSVGGVASGGRGSLCDVFVILTYLLTGLQLSL